MRRLLIIVAVALSAVLAAAGIAFAESADDNGIPVMTVMIDENADGYGTIDQMHDSIDHSAQCTGTVDIHVPDGFRTDYSDVAFKDMNGLQLNYIRGRGNSTWMAVKKPYKIRFAEEQDLFGMGDNEHWVLIANHYDKTKVRNRITYWLGRELGMEFTPHGVPVDLYFKTLDGSRNQYMGTYYLCEQIRVGKNRVEIDELGKKDTTEPAITGGYLLNFETIEDELDGYVTNRDCRFYFDTPTLKNQNAGRIAQREYITNFLQETEDLIFAEDYDHDAVAARMDLQSAADYWWIQVFSNNGDAFVTSSTYLYKKRDTEAGAGKLYWGPLWDFDLAWLTEVPTDFGVTETTAWIDQLRKVDPQFQQLLEERWEVIDSKLQAMSREGGIIDQYRDELRASWEADYAVYGNHEYSWTEDGEWDGTYDSEFDDLQNLVDERRAYVNSNLGFIVSGLCKVDYYVDGQLFESVGDFPYGSFVLNPPDAPEKDGYVFAGWYTEDGEELYTYKVLEDTDFYAKYVLDSEATKATQLFFREYDPWMSPTMEPYETDVQILPYEADDKRVSWTSSDDSIAPVDPKGRVTAVAVGWADITGTLTSGVSNTFRIHVYDDEDETLLDPVEGEAICETPELTVAEAGSTQFRWHTEPRNEFSTLTNLAVHFESDDEGIATVDDYGVILGISEGTTTIRSEIDNGTDEPIVMECKVTVTGQGAQAPVSIGNALVVLAASDYTYNGKVIKPSVKTVGGKTLVNGTDYTVSYSPASPKSVGQYTVTVTGKGSYTGTAKAIFRINPKGVTSKKLKKGKSALKVKWKKRKAKMAKARVNGYQIQIATDKSFKSVVKTVKVKGWKKSSKWVSGLKKKTRYYTRVRTYMKVGSVTYYSTWGKVRKAKTR